MEASVKYLHFANSGTKPALCLRGTKFASCVVNDDGTVRVEKVPLKEYDQMRVVPKDGKPYDPHACAQFFLDLTARPEIRREATLGALELIRRVLHGNVATEDVDFTAPSDIVIKSKAKKHSLTGGESDEPAKLRSTLLASICTELSIEPTVARRKLRKAGMSAPYEDEAAIRAALK